MKKRGILFVIVLLVLSSFVYAGTLKVTSEHPFLINGEWIPAKELKIGDRLTEINGKIVEITSIKKVVPKEPFLVYNLEAGKYHNFIVRDTDNLSIVVHNSNKYGEPFECVSCPSAKNCPLGNKNPGYCGGGYLLEEASQTEYGGVLKGLKNLRLWSIKESLYQDDISRVLTYNLPINSIELSRYYKGKIPIDLSSYDYIRYKALTQGRIIDVQRNIQSGKVMHFGESAQGTYIFAINKQGEFFIANRKSLGNQKLPHSVLARGQPIVAAGEVHFVDGKIDWFNSQTGHYFPGPSQKAIFDKQINSLFRIIIDRLGLYDNLKPPSFVIVGQTLVDYPPFFVIGSQKIK